jgi:hypothetical protein
VLKVQVHFTVVIIADLEDRARVPSGPFLKSDLISLRPHQSVLEMNDDISGMTISFHEYKI